MSVIYAGPGKVFINPPIPSGSGINLFGQGEGGEVKAEIAQEASDASGSMFGRVTSFQGNAQVNIELTPFDDWTLLPVLFPAYLGVTVGATTGVLKIGTHPHNPMVAGTPAADTTCNIWTPDGRGYNFARCAIIKPPDIHLGVDKGFFGAVNIVGLVKTGATLGTANALYTITETTTAPGGYGTATDPGAAISEFDVTNIPRGAWIGAWGSVSGMTDIEAEDEWTISSEVKYTAHAAQKLVRVYTLTSVKFMVKVRPVGPTHTALDTAIGVNSGTAGRTLGSRFASGTASDLVLVNGVRSITLPNADVVGVGYEFGGSKLGTGEIGFINGMTFTAGVPNALLKFTGS